LFKMPFMEVNFHTLFFGYMTVFCLGLCVRLSSFISGKKACFFALLGYRNFAFP
jgi:hypothetical protein